MDAIPDSTMIQQTKFAHYAYPTVIPAPLEQLAIPTDVILPFTAMMPVPAAHAHRSVVPAWIVMAALPVKLDITLMIPATANHAVCCPTVLHAPVLPPAQHAMTVFTS